MINIHSIQTKLAFFIFLLILSSTLIIATLLYNRSAATIRNEVSTSMQKNLSELVDNVDQTLQDIEFSYADLLIDRDLIDFLENKSSSTFSYSEFAYQYDIRDRINNRRLLNNNIDSVYVYDNNDRNLIDSNRGGYMTDADLSQLGWYNWFADRPAGEGSSCWTIKPDLFAINVTERRKYMASCQKNIVRQNVVGKIYVNISERTIHKWMTKLNVGDNGRIMIVDQAGNVVSHSDISKIDSNMRGTGNVDTILARDHGYFVDKSEKALYVFRTSKSLGWSYIAVISTDLIYSKINDIYKLTVLICVASLLIAMAGTLILSRYIYVPIYRLMVSMRKAGQGDLTVSVANSRKDEFGQLNASYNMMISRIKTMVDELYYQKLLMTEMELKLLQSQISPHFLYNTFDMIHWIARFHKIDAICDITFALSKFFRLSLSEGRDIIRVREAVEMAGSYLSIQKFRYPDQFEVFIDIDPEIESYMVPKLIFQPLIENAVVHGLSRKRKDGEIHFTGSKREGNMLFQVKDNGIGIDSEKLDQILQSLGSNNYTSEGNFALRNVNQQIQLLYGPEYRLSIVSRKNAGTTVTIRLPVTTLGEGDHA